jgi:molecular chaperone DnaK
MLKVHLGIDLGTTTTLAAFRLEGHSDSTLHDVEFVLAEPGGSKRSCPYLPSLATLYGPDCVAVGLRAQNLRLPGQVHIRSVKRFMGTRNTYVHPGTEDVLAPEHISGYYLKALREQVLEQLVRLGIAPRSKAADKLVRSATVTVPAAFGGPERAATLAAARLAGFETVLLIDEPTAALLYYVESYSGPDGVLSFGTEPTVVLVYDLGGGTLDVSVCEVSRGSPSDPLEVRVLGRSPREDIGGDDVDLVIAAELFEQCCQEWGWESLQDRDEQVVPVAHTLLEMAESLKVQLNELYVKAAALGLDSAALKRRSVPVPEREVAEGLLVPFDLRLGVERFEKLLETLQETAGPMSRKSFLRPLGLALGDAGITAEKVSYVFLAGGGTRLEVVRRALREYLGLPGQRFFSLDVQRAVARGAALYGELRSSVNSASRLVFKDRLASSYYLAEPFRVSTLIELIPQDAEAGFKKKVELVAPSFLNTVRLQVLHGQNPASPEYLFPVSWTSDTSSSPHLQLHRTWARGERAELLAELLGEQEVRLTLSFPKGGEVHELNLGGLEHLSDPPAANYKLSY